MSVMKWWCTLEGFMDEADWRGSVVDMKLKSGVFWPIPVTMSVSEEEAGKLA